MANNSVTVSQLPNTSFMSSTDRIVVLSNTVGNASVRTIAMSNFSNSIILANAPANSSSNGFAGAVAYDNTYFYVCIANNSWVRTNLSTF